jgi:hypothetical protein
MSFRALVYLQRPGHTEGVYLGEIVLDLRPVKDGRTRFMHEGKVESGHIDSVMPPNWDSIGVIPTIYVVQGERA